MIDLFTFFLLQFFIEFRREIELMKTFLNCIILLFISFMINFNRIYPKFCIYCIVEKWLHIMHYLRKLIKRFYLQAWTRIWTQISKYEKILSRQPIIIHEEKELKNDNEEIGKNEVKEAKDKVKEKGKEKNKKTEQIKRLSKAELAVTVELEIPQNRAQNPGVHDIMKNTGAHIKNPDLYTLGAQCVCVKLLTDSLLSALFHDQYERKENFNTKLIAWEVRYFSVYFGTQDT